MDACNMAVTMSSHDTQSVSNHNTLKSHYFTILPDSNPPSDCPHIRFKFS